MAITSFKQLQQFITKVLTDNGDWGLVGNSPHGAFWNDLSYDQFISAAQQVPNTGTGPILVPKNSAGSNIIIAMKSGSMPMGGTPFTTDQINEITGWIDAGCPQ